MEQLCEPCKLPLARETPTTPCRQGAGSCQTGAGWKSRPGGAGLPNPSNLLAQRRLRAGHRRAEPGPAGKSFPWGSRVSAPASRRECPGDRPGVRRGSRGTPGAGSGHARGAGRCQQGTQGHGPGEHAWRAWECWWETLTAAELLPRLPSPRPGWGQRPLRHQARLRNKSRKSPNSQRQKRNQGLWLVQEQFHKEDQAPCKSPSHGTAAAEPCLPGNVPQARRLGNQPPPRTRGTSSRQRGDKVTGGLWGLSSTSHCNGLPRLSGDERSCGHFQKSWFGSTCSTKLLPERCPQT